MAKKIPARVVAMCVAVSVVSLTLSAPADAARKTISGKLNKPGYTVIAMAASGKAKVVHAKRGKFRFKRPAKIVTLHLRGPDGVYAGPIVVGREEGGKRAILGVKAGAKLGKVKVKRRKGYAKARTAKKFVDESRTARAKKGVPIGAGKFGRVRSKHTGGGAPGDRDLDGIPGSLDIDDDGDRILDRNDRSSSVARAAALEREGSILDQEVLPGPIARLNLFLEQTTNANAAVLTDQLIDATLMKSLVLGIGILPGDSAELDCGDAQNGLSYCRPGGTGTAAFLGSQPGALPPFPGPPGGPFDPDGDGFGTLMPSGAPVSGTVPSELRPNATNAQIGTGDVLIQRATTDGVETQYPTAIGFVFATVPALVSFSDSAGNSTTVPYPVALGAPGTQGNPFPVSAGPDGNVVLTLSFWRPQRKPIPPEAGDWTDIGGLIYSATTTIGGPGDCPAATFSESDPNLVLSTVDELGIGLRDQALDRPASPANTFTHTLNLTQCLASKGLSFNPGQQQGIQFSGTAGGGLAGSLSIASQIVSFKRQ